tara:strand:- start:265 stop:468 length:204 start_codon:yes stop_codon:yes gene_type:complete
MDSKKNKEFKHKDKVEINKDIQKHIQELDRFNLDRLSGKLKDTTVFSKIRKKIARLKTQLNHIEEMR